MDEDNDEDDNNGRGRRLMAASNGGRFHTQQSNEGQIDHKQKEVERGEGNKRIDEGMPTWRRNSEAALMCYKQGGGCE